MIRLAVFPARPVPGQILGRLEAAAGLGWAAGGPVVVILSPAGFLLHLRIAPATPGGV